MAKNKFTHVYLALIPFEFVDQSNYQHEKYNNYGFIYLGTTCLQSMYMYFNFLKTFYYV